jgi:hypothetical protein
VKFPTTVQDIDELIELLKELDAEDKLYLATELFGCGEDETDKYGQVILHTNLKWFGNDVKEMSEDDFKEEEDILDL